jgi:hypothetical protein
MFYPGEVFFLPPDRRPDGDSVARRHVLLANCDDGGSMATLAFASRQPTEAAFGASNVLVNPTATGYRRSGFDFPTYVYPSRIVGTNPEDLNESEGRVIDEMPLIRQALVKALGFGTGTSTGTGSASKSWRGRVVRLHSTLAAELGSEFAVIVSEPGYSLEQRFQNVVPIVHGDAYDAEGLDVPIQGDSYSQLGDLGTFLASSFLYTEAVFAVFQPEEIVAYATDCLDEGTMRELENALAIYFEL